MWEGFGSPLSPTRERSEKMQYVIMMTIVFWLAIADFVTGIIKGYVTGTLSSTKMRKGGLNKLGELIVMTTACGLEAGLKALGRYYETPDELAGITGKITAILVFSYIVLMEVISILENFAEINPDAAGWITKLLKRLKNTNDNNNDKEDK